MGHALCSNADAPCLHGSEQRSLLYGCGQKRPCICPRWDVRWSPMGHAWDLEEKIEAWVMSSHAILESASGDPPPNCFSLCFYTPPCRKTLLGAKISYGIIADLWFWD